MLKESAQRNYGIPILEDVQDLAGHVPEQPDLITLQYFKQDFGL